MSNELKKIGDYIIAVKGNQGSFEEEVHNPCRPIFESCQVENGHERIEIRRCEVFEKSIFVDPV